MDEKLLLKMVRNCFLQYEYLIESFPLHEEDIVHLCQEVQRIKENDKESSLHDIIQDVVYEYVTQ
ncbi:hypothetical protein EJF36_20020 [Bacillus sp. HMF5848]|uniref:YqzH family protein n=1 Tax=Bacillus sp. HMF5848 TaxID=2495421 RepID=UPI000F7A4654|nr:YqzH family protein [Bacillus sp. HMF5848]RSK28983.1 hypothetical protein EJF36_20020 [Bacillus sp. HMF5848]